MQGSHGVPGIFFKYDMSSVKVKVKEEHQPLWKFIVRLCGIVGGIYVTSGIVNSLVGIFVDLIFCRSRKNLIKNHIQGASLVNNEIIDPNVSNIAFSKPAVGIVTDFENK